MEGYCGDGDKVDDILVSNDQEAWSKFQSVARWKQWGVNAEDSFGSVDNNATDEGDISCETLMDELEMDCRVDEEDESEISDVKAGGISEPSNCWATFLNNQDIQLDGFPRTIQTDENFVNSMLLDDVRVGQQYQRTSSTVDNLHNMEISYENFEVPGPGPLNSFNLENQSDASHQNLSNSISKDVLVSDEETVLRDVGKAMHKMTDNSRLCIRDALYRLANNSGKQSGAQGQHGAECTSEEPLTTYLLDRSLRSADKHASESGNNAIEVTIVDLMFNKPYQQYDDCHQGRDSTHKLRRIDSPKERLTPQFHCNTLIPGDAEVSMHG